MVLHGATPAAYQAWLARLIAAAREQTVGGEALVCVNAWNEWAEGAYLEPDVHFGAAFLNATGRAVSGGGDGPAARGCCWSGTMPSRPGRSCCCCNSGRRAARGAG